MKGELAKRGENHAVAYTLIQQIGETRLDDRVALLKQFDHTRRLLDNSGNLDVSMVSPNKR